MTMTDLMPSTFPDAYKYPTPWTASTDSAHSWKVVDANGAVLMDNIRDERIAVRIVVAVNEKGIGDCDPDYKYHRISCAVFKGALCNCSGDDPYKRAGGAAMTITTRGTALLLLLPFVAAQVVGLLLLPLSYVVAFNVGWGCALTFAKPALKRS